MDRIKRQSTYATRRTKTWTFIEVENDMPKPFLRAKIEIKREIVTISIRSARCFHGFSKSSHLQDILSSMFFCPLFVYFLRKFKNGKFVISLETTYSFCFHLPFKSKQRRSTCYFSFAISIHKREGISEKRYISNRKK